jgi:hypothetical protein
MATSPPAGWDPSLVTPTRGEPGREAQSPALSTAQKPTLNELERKVALLEQENWDMKMR